MHAIISLRDDECKPSSNLRNPITCCITAQAPLRSDVLTRPTRSVPELTAQNWPLTSCTAGRPIPKTKEDKSQPHSVIESIYNSSNTFRQSEFGRKDAMPCCTFTPFHRIKIGESCTSNSSDPSSLRLYMHHWSSADINVLLVSPILFSHIQNAPVTSWIVDTAS